VTIASEDDPSLVKKAAPSKFTSHRKEKAEGLKENYTWIVTWHIMDDVSWSVGICIILTFIGETPTKGHYVHETEGI
jgi:hypothetical protein